MAGRLSLEVAKTVVEVADVAWAAVECCHHHHHHRDHDSTPSPPATEERRDFDAETLRSDNERLRQLLEKNLNLLHQISYLEKAEFFINDDNEEPSLWVLVSEDMVPNKTEEKSGIDNENYVVVSEEHVVDGVATFMARCILANPKSLSLSPIELQKAVTKTLGGMNKVEKMLNIWHAGKVFYLLATWGLALASLYRGRAMLKLATLGVHHSSKMALKVL
ncbi:Unknown protein [Striga hermonthica]|uniref:Uncharacterized protein n=1 Tax=Striga hermonthica TaxID=68872 RepID=A0A9N7R7D0_STRHE|nr:Unknown protein [Striga hermonthica]